jgi:flavin-dependent dehydrogenase
MTENLVAGGGLAGSAAAIALAQAGREVVLIERASAPAHKICGEFLSTEAQAYVSALGLDLTRLGGHEISQLRLIRGSRVVATKLPFTGLGLTRRTLDEALLAHAAACGVDVRRGEVIRRIDAATGEVEAKAVWHPANLFLATGKHEVRGAARAVDKPGRMIGLKSYFALAPAELARLAGTIELYLLPGGYGGLQRVEGGDANFCVLVDQAVFKEKYGTWPHYLEACMASAPVLAARLGGAAALSASPLTIARVPYGFLHRAAPSDSAYRLGDQAAVIHSFTGDGMSIALHSAALAARFALCGQNAGAYHRQLAADVAGQLRRATLMQAALRAPGLGPVLFAAAQIFPAVLAAAAALTRVPPAARLT